MKLALKTHRVAPIGLLQAGLAALAALVGGHLVTLPGPAGEAPLGMFLALLGTLLIAPALVRAWPSTRTDAVRSAGLLAAVMVSLQIGPALVASALAALLAGPEVLAYVGMLTWLLALQIVGGVLVSATHQGLVPAVYVLICALLGRIDGVVQPWAWPLADIGPAVMALLGMTALMSSLGLLVSCGLRVRPVSAS
ncbi:hypothetical protein [Microbacterium sp. PA5]|uniref:hypothetical protein n=1 Tax=Microbacterium sp. PA5 TaxID=3416654 RepID=UPI003CF19084